MNRGSCFALSLLFSVSAWANDCTRQDVDAADAALSHMNSWTEVAAVFRRFSKCDDGYIAEGFSDRVSRLLANHWDQVHDLVALNRTTPGLESFVVRHLDDTINLTDAQTISRLAKNSCPKGGKSLCRKIDKRLGNVENIQPDAT
jgi:hypothetical protein